ncbi:ankyrin repeat-containing protein [Tanacetum coccineum]
MHGLLKMERIEVLKILMEMHSELSMTSDPSNTTALHTASEQGHIEVVNYLLEKNSSMANIARSNLKTALHSCARKGHLEVVKALSQKVPTIVGRADKKGQTALHMAVKGQNVEVVNALIEAHNALINMVDKWDNTALHITTRKVAQTLDTAGNLGQIEIATICFATTRVPKHQSIKRRPLPLTPKTRELKQTVSDIKHNVHDQLEHTLKTQKRVKVIGKRINKMHLEGLNNAINSTTVVAVLIATVTFAAIFQLPGQYVDGTNGIPDGFTMGEGNIASKPEFIVFLIFDSLALFISLAVVVVQTSIVVVEKRAKKQVMAVINKLMWLACVFVSVAFLALSFIVVGNEKWLAVGVTVIGSLTLASTLGTMLYWVIMHRIEASNIKSRRLERSSKSISLSVSPQTDSEDEDFKKLYAI